MVDSACMGVPECVAPIQGLYYAILNSTDLQQKMLCAMRTKIFGDDFYENLFPPCEFHGVRLAFFYEVG